MNEKMRMFIICSFFALLRSCGNFTGSLSEQGGPSEQVSSDTIKFSEFTVKIKNKDNSNNWTDFGTLVIRKEEDGIGIGLNAGLGHTATFFSLEESEVNNFVKAMTKGGSFKTSLYYGYKTEQNNVNGIKNKEIKTKIETINGSEYITFAGDKIVKNEEDEEDEEDRNLEDKTAEYAIPLEELKKNLK